MKLLIGVLFSLASFAGYAQQLPSQVQAKRGVFTERFFLKDRWIDKISADLNTSDSLADNVLPTGKAIADFVKRKTANYIQNQDSVPQQGNLWIQGKAIVGSLQIDSPDVTINSLGGSGNVLVGADHFGAIQKISLGQGLYYHNGTLNANQEPYLKYIALMFQQDHYDPTDTYLENTFQGQDRQSITSTRDSTGKYTGTIPLDLYPWNVWFQTQVSDANGNAVFIRMYYTGLHTIKLTVKDINGNYTDNWTMSVEIRVYPYTPA